MRKRNGLFRTAAFAVPWLLLTAVALTSATYAWFTSNRRVSTNAVTARTAEERLSLEISSTGGTRFSPQSPAALVQVNEYASTALLPVSTSDLKTFLYSPAVSDSGATGFAVLTQEQYYYHGRVYLRAQAAGLDEGARLALYLDDSGQLARLLDPDPGGLILNAARLGLVFDGGDPIILRLCETGNDEAQKVRNTYLGGELLEDGWVLSGPDSAVRDPSVPLARHTISVENGALTLPERPLALLETNRIYTLDVYFYLEGCDPDCSNSVSYSGVDLQLAFYGLLEEAE